MPRKRKTSRGYSQRKVDTREIKQRFLIVCEGEKTEPNYFRNFRVSKVVVDIKGLGTNPSNLVQETKKLRDKEKQDYNQVWCVFDRDSWQADDFNSAIRDAKREKIKVAYSNEAFELWYLLHFEFVNTGIPRKDYKKKLTKRLGYKYQKNSDSIYDDLIDKQDTAIENAENLLKQYDPHNPAKDNPSTTVHLLVQELKRFIT
ncbi:MAG: RloB domain-containing protein [Symploca sp. SIO2G7]|nr:RloB domain-containing protein [Symploca sp. SIO2G7]